MPSVASEVASTLALVPLPRPRPQSAASDEGGRDFASLLDDQAPIHDNGPVPLESADRKTTSASPAQSDSSQRDTTVKTAPNVRDTTEIAPAPNVATGAKSDVGDLAAPTPPPNVVAKAQAIPVADEGMAGEKATDDPKAAEAAAPAITPIATVQSPVAAPVPISTAAPAQTTISSPSDGVPSVAGAGPAIAVAGNIAQGRAPIAAAAIPFTAVASDASGQAPAVTAASDAAAVSAPASQIVTQVTDISRDPGAKAPATDAAEKPVPADAPHGKAATVAPATASDGPDAASPERPAGRPAIASQNEPPAAGDQPPAPGAKTDADPAPNFGFTVQNATPANAAPAGAQPPAAMTAAAVPIAGLAVEIAARAHAGVNRFDIRLDPPELGRIDVRLDVDRDGQVTSQMTVDRPETLSLLQRDQPQIERALEQAGLKTADNGLQFSLRDQSFAGRDDTGRQPMARPVVSVAEPSPVAPSQTYGRTPAPGGVDIRV